MLKKLSQILLIVIFLIIAFCVYLSVYGINTDKLNGIINEKISQKDSDFDIKLNKIKIFLNIGSLKLEIPTCWIIWLAPLIKELGPFCKSGSDALYSPSSLKSLEYLSVSSG